MYVFGKTQVLTSRRMQNRAWLAKIIYRIFGYTSLGNYARAQVFIRLIKRLPVERFRHILDLGCGLGEYSFMLAEALPRAKVTAIDILPGRVAEVKKAKAGTGMHNLEVYQSKIEELPAEYQFDFIFSVDVFEHIREQEMPFEEAYRRLRPGGFLLVKMPGKQQQTFLPESWFEEHREWLEHEHVGQVYELDDLKERFKQQGFQLIYAAYADGPLSRIAWEISYLAKKGGAVFQLLLLPLCKALVWLDNLRENRRQGNTIQVIGKKPGG